MKMCAGMEAAIANMLEPGETIVVGNNGIWGERACEIAERYGGMILDHLTCDKLQHAVCLTKLTKQAS